MKKKKYLQGVTFFVEPDMYEEIKINSDQREISVSELLRELIANHFNTAKGTTARTRDDESPSIVK